MKSTYITYGLNIDYDKLASLKKEDLHARISNLLDESTVDEIIKKIIDKKDCTETDAAVLIAGVLQSGGSNKSAQSTTSYSVDDLTLDAKELQSIIYSVKRNATTRQLARTIASDIAKIASALEIEGDLAGQMRYEHPDLSKSDAIWCSNFQTTNPDCPKNVREWLVQNYKSRFNK